MMAKWVNFREFRKMCGTEEKPLSHQTFHSSIRRSHLKVNKTKKLVNVHLKINEEYIKKKRNEALEKLNDPETKYEIAHAKRKLEIQKMEEEAEIVRIKRQKLQGELIPTSLVSSIFATHFKSITKSFHNAAEQIATDAVKRLKGKENDLAWLKGSLILTINNAVTKAKTMTEKDVKNLVDEYSKITNKK